MTHSKNKGNAFERKISKLLSERFEKITGVKTGFVRNADSGSFFGGKNQTRVDTHLMENACFGDIKTPSNFKFSVECKHYKTPPSFASIIKQEYKLFDTWIEQARQDALNSGKKMLIIIKFNSVPEFVIVEDVAHDAFGRYKEYHLVELSKWLSQADSHFFN